MGNLLRVLAEKPVGPKVDFFVDFEKAEPTDGEKEVHSQVAACLSQSAELLQQMKNYKGAGEEIKNAISNASNEEFQSMAWAAVSPLVQKLKVFYDFSETLDSCIIMLLRALTSTDRTPSEHLETQQALSKQFAEILDFTLSFDDLKMNNPAIQNDFSYYRRTKNRKRLDDIQNLTPQLNGEELEIPDDIANRMSLFYANPTPMLNAIANATTKFTKENPDIPLENTTDVICTMAAVCRVMTENPGYSSRFQREDTALFCLRVMVGVIILYDHVHPIGAFAKNAKIDVRATVKLLKEHPRSSETLLNALKYNTKHFNDEDTPKAIQQILS